MSSSNVGSSFLMPAARSAIVVGGGFTGLVVAAALARIGVDVEVLEARVGVDPRFRGELLHPRAVRVLDSLGLGDAMRQNGAVTIDGFAVLEAPAASPLRLSYGDSVCARGLAMDHRVMVGALREALEGRARVRVTTGARVADVVRSGGSVTGVRLADGSVRSAELVVIAEGRHSRLRTALAFAHESSVSSFTAALECHDVSLPASRHGHVFLGAKGPILAYPIGRRRVRMCIDLPSALEKDRATLLADLRDHYAPHVPDSLREGMLRALDEGEVELCGNHAIYVERAIAAGVALVGDAAGCSHPLTASGMTLGANDALLLADAIANESDLRTALLRYERERTPFARTREILTAALYDVFLAKAPETRAMRSGILAYWRGTERARRASMALLSGDDLAVAHFAEEYVRVFGRAAVVALAGAESSRDENGFATALALLRLTGEKVETSARAVVSALGIRGGLPSVDSSAARVRSTVRRPMERAEARA